MALKLIPKGCYNQHVNELSFLVFDFLFWLILITPISGVSIRFSFIGISTLTMIHLHSIFPLLIELLNFDNCNSEE